MNLAVRFTALKRRAWWHGALLRIFIYLRYLWSGERQIVMIAGTWGKNAKERLFIDNVIVIAWKYVRT
jgi:hypothetical protein